MRSAILIKELQPTSFSAGATCFSFEKHIRQREFNKGLFRKKVYPDVSLKKFELTEPLVNKSVTTWSLVL